MIRWIEYKPQSLSSLKADSTFPDARGKKDVSGEGWGYPHTFHRLGVENLVLQKSKGGEGHHLIQ